MELKHVNVSSCGASTASFNRTLNGIETCLKSEALAKYCGSFNRTLNGIETVQYQLGVAGLTQF